MTSSGAKPLWHLLQVSDVLDLELATALSDMVPLLAWEPQRMVFPWRTRIGQEQERIADSSYGGAPLVPTVASSSFRIRQLPLLRGFARAPMSWIARTGPTVLARLLHQTSEPAISPLICTTPYFAGVAERWPGPVVYWLTDLIAEYSSARRSDVIRLDQRMCRAATLVCPNSRRLQSYLLETAGCDPTKIVIVPNATRASNLLHHPTPEPAPLPTSIKDLVRPVAGVIGNLAGNMDWLLLERMIKLTPWLHWIFVGPTSMHVADAAARGARTHVMQMDHTQFVGRQSYASLASYAQSFDVAVLPYLRREPTYSGSSTRFYEHLASCRPMIATRGLEELTQKPPLLTLFDTADEGVAILEQLRSKHFDDGLADLRWHASMDATWNTRARSIHDSLMLRLTTPQSKPSEEGADTVSVGALGRLDRSSSR